MLCVESLVRFRGVYLYTYLGLSRLRFMSRTWWSLQLLHKKLKEDLKPLSGVSKSQVGVLVVAVDRAVHGLGQVGFRPSPDLTRRCRVEGRSNPKPTAGKIGRFGFLWWLGLDRLPELKKASKFEKKASPESGKFFPKTGFFLKSAFFFSLEIVGFGRIWLNPTRYSRIWSRSR